MSEFTTIRDAIESPFTSIINWWEGTSIGQAVDADAKSAIAELEMLSESDAKQLGLTIGTAALAGLATGGAAGAFAAGVAAAPAAFKAAAADVSQKTINTLVTTVVNQLQALSTATVVASPAPVV